MPTTKEIQKYKFGNVTWSGQTMGATVDSCSYPDGSSNCGGTVICEDESCRYANLGTYYYYDYLVCETEPWTLGFRDILSVFFAYEEHGLKAIDKDDMNLEGFLNRAQTILDNLGSDQTSVIRSIIDPQETAEPGSRSLMGCELGSIPLSKSQTNLVGDIPSSNPAGVADTEGFVNSRHLVSLPRRRAAFEAITVDRPSDRDYIPLADNLDDSRASARANVGLFVEARSTDATLWDAAVTDLMTDSRLEVDEQAGIDTLAWTNQAMSNNRNSWFSNDPDWGFSPWLISKKRR